MTQAGAAAEAGCAIIWCTAEGVRLLLYAFAKAYFFDIDNQ
jgi:hypothetical protein